MVARKVERKFTPQEYYALERTAEMKSEFFDGRIRAMAGGSPRHSLVKVNLVGELRSRLKGNPCAAYDSDLRIKVKSTGLRAYPDATIVCGRIEFDEEDQDKQTVVNPTVLFEVLSDSTESHDRGKKATHYRRIDSLQALVFVSQGEPKVEVFERDDAGGWKFSEVSGLEAGVRIPAVEIILPLAELYDRVEFDPPEEF